ncbi:hypothetical protein BDF20DRAFT_917194 [Mycotypha africana]|uniref:uncharacterized protein n=1 Tax=Mycotypha africana TaxID=64632 RepID=UPI00230176F4|nr:uncharacterized protein BDF20DRAFT_917194 [Mycotypha africana]KAI8967948.1 hypothetical protein BDF20DRAFT_917194 [Mycotypha africana]
MTTTTAATMGLDLEKLTKGWSDKFKFVLEDESKKIEISELSSPDLKLEDSDSSCLLNAASINSSSNTTTSDLYLQSILSSAPSSATAKTTEACTGNSDCVCYKCQRQRRRAVTFRSIAPKALSTINAYTPLDKLQTGTSTENDLSSRACPEQFAAITSNEKTLDAVKENQEALLKRHQSVLNTIINPPGEAAQQQLANKTSSKKRTNTLRKTPTIKSYEKHMPPPEYPEDDSIYRTEKQRRKLIVSQQTKDLAAGGVSSRNTISLEEQSCYRFPQKQQQSDDYKISWKEDETGDDLLTSLVTFQTIFEEKGSTNEGLSDLLEQRAKELKYQKLKEKEEKARQSKSGADLPPRLPDCLTLSYRNGSRHTSLTLFHTMKMKNEKARTQAYDAAFHQCMHADSSMRQWLKRKREAPKQENSRLIQTVRRSTVKKGFLTSLSGRKNKITSNDNVFQLTSGSLSSTNEECSNYCNPVLIANGTTVDKRSMDIENVNIRTRQQQQQTPHSQDGTMDPSTLTLQPQLPELPIDIPLQQTKGSFDYNEAWSRLVPINIPFTISNNDRKENRDNSSIISLESNNSKKAQANILRTKSSRLFSSIGRKASIKPPKSNSSQRTPSIRSFEKIDSGIKIFSMRKAAK